MDMAAKEGDPSAIAFPRAHIEDAPYDFSFSGLKSAVLNYINKCKMTGQEISVPDVAASFQQAVVDVLLDNAMRAAKDRKIRKLALAGGVASNSAIRAAFAEKCARKNIELYIPPLRLCTDNGAMIAASGYYEYNKGIRHGLDLNAVPGLGLNGR